MVAITFRNPQEIVGRQRKVPREDLRLEGGVEFAEEIQTDRKASRYFRKVHKIIRLNDVVPEVRPRRKETQVIVSVTVDINDRQEFRVVVSRIKSVARIIEAIDDFR